ncbi:Hypothetical predicted protein, partial [Olea europaea subsp. europaea]
MIVSMKIQSIEGRNLNLKDKNDLNAYSINIVKTNVAAIIPPPTPPVLVAFDSRQPSPGHADDFRPTTP